MKGFERSDKRLKRNEVSGPYGIRNEIIIALDKMDRVAGVGVCRRLTTNFRSVLVEVFK